MSKAISLVGIVSPGAAAVAEPEKSDPNLGTSIIPGAALGVTGFFYWKEHPVLGFLAGDAIGLNAYRLYRGQGVDRARAITNLAVAGTAIVGSLAWKKHPFWGWVLGHLVGSVVTAVVPGSTSYKAIQEF